MGQTFQTFSFDPGKTRRKDINNKSRAIIINQSSFPIPPIPFTSIWVFYKKKTAKTDPTDLQLHVLYLQNVVQIRLC